MRLPVNASVPELQAAIRTLQRQIDELNRSTVDLQGGRITNAAIAKKGGDYVTLSQVKKILKDAGIDVT